MSPNPTKLGISRPSSSEMLQSHREKYMVPPSKPILPSPACCRLPIDHVANMRPSILRQPLPLRCRDTLRRSNRGERLQRLRSLLRPAIGRGVERHLLQRHRLLHARGQHHRRGLAPTGRPMETADRFDPWPGRPRMDTRP